jgi:hypothetical protein
MASPVRFFSATILYRAPLVERAGELGPFLGLVSPVRISRWLFTPRIAVVVTVVLFFFPTFPIRTALYFLLLSTACTIPGDILGC